MKAQFKYCFLGLLFLANLALAQTFPVNNLTVAGTANFVGAVNLPTAGVGNNSTTAASTSFVVNHSPCASIADHGGVADAVTDNTAAFFATAAASGGGTLACVYFPVGTWAFSGNVSYTLPNVNSVISIQGAGAEQSILLWNGGGGLTLNLPGGKGNRFQVRDVSFYTGAVGAGNGLFINNSAVTSTPIPSGLSDISNVSFHGKDGFGVVDYWGNAVNILNYTNVNFYNDSFYGGGGGGTISGYTNQGGGVQLSAVSPPGEFSFNFNGCFFGYLANGIIYGNNAQGVTVANSNFVGGNVGINITATTGADELMVTSSQFNVGLNAIADPNGTADLAIVGNYFLIPSGASGTSIIAINLGKVGSAAIHGNFFRPASGGVGAILGIVIGNSTLVGAVISGNVFTQLTTGVLLNAGSSFNNVYGNIFKTVTNAVTNNGGATCPPSVSGNCVGTASP